MLRSSFGLLIAVCIVILALGISAGSSAGVTQPMPTVPVEMNQALYEAWLNSCQKPLTDEEHITATVDTYYRLKYDSRLDRTIYDISFLFDVEDQVGRDTYAYVRGRLQYELTGWQLTNTLIDSYEYAPEYERIEVEGDRAEVVVRPLALLRFTVTPDRIDRHGGAIHYLELIRRDSRWLIRRDDFKDELSCAIPYGTDFDELTRTLPEAVRADAERGRDLEAQLRKDPRLAKRFGEALSGTFAYTYRDLNRPAVGWYALQYSNNNEDCSTTNYSTLFRNYASQCADCQNFVSQCIWYGFGGSNTSEAIQGHWVPMVDGVSGATNWWADNSGTSTNWTWTNVPYFENMIKSNWDNNKVGVQGEEGFLWLTWQGDYISMRCCEHVFIINDVIDHDGDGETDYDEIYVSAHTNNLRNERLSDRVTDPRNVKYMWVNVYKCP